MRPFTRADYNAIKTATQFAIDDVGTLAQVAEHTRVGVTRLSEYANRDHPFFIPLDVAMDLDTLSGGARILKAYAAALGYDLVLNEKGVRVECTLRHIGEVGKASGNLHAAMCDAASDGKITPTEAERIERKATILDDATDLLRGDMRRIRAVE